MALPKLYNLARVLSSTVGTGTVTLGPSVQGFLTFAQAGVPNGTQVPYGIRDGANSEVGIGTYGTIGPTLTRDSVTNSTNLGALINLSGSEEVYITARAEDIQAVVDLSNSLAPFDALAYNGMQINGGMEVSQELPSGRQFNNASGPLYCMDGWLCQIINASATGLLNAFPGGTYFSHLGFANFIALVPDTPIASIAAGDLVYLVQRIEGFRISRLAWGTANAQPITIGFWTAHNRTGLYSVAVRNGSNTRSYITTYTQNATDAHEYKTVTIPGDTAGTWPIDNTNSLVLSFCVASGATYTTAANVWTAGNFLAASGQVNGFAAVGNHFRLTGVTVLPGTQAPTAAQSPNIMRPYGEELRTCQRYLVTDIAVAVDFYNGSGIHAMQVTYPVTMRATPTWNFGTPLLSSGISTFSGTGPATPVGTCLQATGAANTRIYWYGTGSADARL